MQKLAELCVKRPVFASVLILVLLVFGIFAYRTLGVDRFPKVDFPTITITTVLPGAAPEEIETELTDKIEEAVNTVSGIDELRSASVEGISQVYVTFVLSKDVDVAAQEVRDRVNRILPDLPQDIDQPTVEKMDPDAAPVLAIALSAPLPMKDITEYADKVLRRQIESIAGVGQVMIVGGQARQINVVLDPLKLRAFNLTVADVAKALKTQNVQVPGGSVKQGAKDFTLRTLGRVTNLAEMGLIPIIQKGDHTVIINDVGTVEDGTEEPQSMARLNDTPALLLNIRKQSGTNTVAVVEAVKERLADITKRLPPIYRMEIVRDQSRFIIASINAVKEHLIIGSFLAAIVVLLFLRSGRTTIIAALAIPTSIVSTFTVLSLMGYTLNMLTLLALTLSVGIVIDDAVVVLENIFRYIDEKRYKPFDAAIAATKEIGPAVMAITLSLIAVFLPIAFMGGIVGRFMQSFGVTMASAIVVSLLVSFTLTPMLSARWLKRKLLPGETENDAPITEEHTYEDFIKEHEHSDSRGHGFYHYLEAAYLGMLKFSLRFRWIVVLVCVAVLATVPPLMKRIPKNFLPTDDQSEFQLNVRTPEGTSLEATQTTLGRMAAELRRLNGVVYTITSVADTDQHTANQGSVYVRLVDPSQRDFGQIKMMDYVRKNVLPKYKAEKLRTSLTEVPAFSGGGSSVADIAYVLSGPEMDKLMEYSQKLKEALAKIPGAVDIDSSLVVGKPEYGVSVDRAKAADLGVSITDIASTLRLLVAGDKVSDYNELGEQYEVHVRARAGARNNVASLGMVTVPSTKGGAFSLADLVKIGAGVGPSQIDRMNRRRQVTITASMAPGASQQAILDQLDAAAKQMHMSPEYSTGLAGRSKELARTAKSFLMTFMMAFVFMYLVIAAQFESWLNPIIILLALPLTLPFALLSLVIFGQSLNIFSTLGVLVLFAVVKKNAILQIDHTNQLRQLGFPRYEAILAANLDRLRPILMTTVAFVAGMMPLLISEGAGAATNRTISSVVIGGQSLSLLLTLLAIPVAYSLFDDMANSRLWSWLKNAPSALFGAGRRAATSFLNLLR